MLEFKKGKSAREIMFGKKTNEETENKGVNVITVYEAEEDYDAPIPIILESQVEEYMKK